MLVEELGNHVLKQLPKSMGYDQRVKIAHSIQDFVRQRLQKQMAADFDLDRLHDERTEQRDALAKALREVRYLATNNRGAVNPVAIKDICEDALATLEDA